MTQIFSMEKVVKPIEIARENRGVRSECIGCGEIFNGLAAFEAHRVGTFESKKNPRRCLTSRELQKGGWTKTSIGRWNAPGSISSPPGKA